MTIYCQNPNCPLENRICCNKCSSLYHKHEITDIYDLKMEISSAADELSKVIDEIQVKLEQITSQANTLIKKLKKDLDDLMELSQNFHLQTKTQLLKGIIKSNETRIQNIIKSSSLKQKVPEKVNPPPVNTFLQNLISNYQSLIKNQHIDEALQCLEDILQMDPQNVQFKLEKSELIQQQLNNRINQAPRLFEQGQYEQALNIYRVVINQNTHDFKVYYQTGVCLINLDQYQESIEYFKLSLMIDESNHDALYKLSQSLYATQDIENLRICHQNLKLHQHPKQQYVEGQLHLLTRDFSKALEIFEILVQKNDQDNYAQFLKAQALIQSGGMQLMMGNAMVVLLQERNYDQEKIKYLQTLVSLQQSKFGKKQ